MTGTPGYTREEIREFVHNYHLQPHGTKLEWIEKQPFSFYQFKRWRRALYEGDLDRNLIPRDHGGMTRTRGEWTAFEKARAQELAEHAAELEQLQTRIRQLEGTNEALGKAIGLLHQMNEQEPTAAAPETPTTPTTSSPSKTDSFGISPK